MHTSIDLSCVLVYFYFWFTLFVFVGNFWFRWKPKSFFSFPISVITKEATKKIRIYHNLMTFNWNFFLGKILLTNLLLTLFFICFGWLCDLKNKQNILELECWLEKSKKVCHNRIFMDHPTWELLLPPHKTKPRPASRCRSQPRPSWAMLPLWPPPQVNSTNIRWVVESLLKRFLDFIGFSLVFWFFFSSLLISKKQFHETEN